MPAPDSTELALSMPNDERRAWLRAVAPDDAADLIEDAPPDERNPLLEPLDLWVRAEVAAVAYKEDEAGGLMNPRLCFRFRSGGLLGVVSLGDLISSARLRRVSQVMRRRF